MRNLLTSLLLLLSTIAYSQSTTITPGAVLPQMTTAQRTGLANPVNGMMVYDLGTSSYWYYQNTVWAELPKAGSTANYWELNGANGNEIKNTNSGGFWSANPTTVASVSGVVNTVPIEGDGTRLMWIPSMSAFRVGTVALGSKAWDKDSVGFFSTAFGYNTKAKGKYSHATGTLTTASGNFATAMGISTIAFGVNSTAIGINTKAFGTSSTSMGISTKAFGDESTAMGDLTLASGITSTSMGKSTKALGDESTAIGNLTIASGTSSTSMGRSTKAAGFASTSMGYQTNAVGSKSFSIGDGTTSSGPASTAMGESTIASGQASTSMGFQTNAVGHSSLSIGHGTTSSGQASTAMGDRTFAKAHYSLTIGRLNNVLDNPDVGIGDDDRIFQIGNGYQRLGEIIRSNAMTVLRNGNIGTYNVLEPLANLHLQYNQPLNWDAHLRLQYDNDDWGNIVYDFDGFKFKTWGANDNFIFRNEFNQTVTSISNTGDVAIAGYTKLGSDSPKMKTRKVTGSITNTYNSCSGFTAQNLETDKILGVSIHVDWQGGWVSPNFTNFSRLEYNYTLLAAGTSGQHTNLVVCIKGSNESLDVRGKPFRALIMYEE